MTFLKTSSQPKVANSTPLLDLFNELKNKKNLDLQERVAKELSKIAKSVALKYFNAVEAPCLLEAAYITMGVVNFYLYTQMESSFLKNEDLKKNLEILNKGVATSVDCTPGNPSSFSEFVNDIGADPGVLRQYFKQGIVRLRNYMLVCHADVVKPNLKNYLVDNQLVPGRPWLGFINLAEKYSKRKKENIEYFQYLNKLARKYFKSNGEDSLFFKYDLSIQVQDLTDLGIYLVFSFVTQKSNFYASECGQFHQFLPMSRADVLKSYGVYKKKGLDLDMVRSVLRKFADELDVKHVDYLLECFKNSSLLQIKESIVKISPSDISILDFKENLSKEELALLRSQPESAIGFDCVACLECGKIFSEITNSHLRKHELTRETYLEKYKCGSRKILFAEKKRALSKSRFHKNCR
ncbi:MucR family transcriptional regulator [Solidesulfovibrio magneticus]|uniref:Uncharacterized protein n=1 Tax=Solidesulfovibrio magneticus (strain ATCC 700980 / DSM 13731 / RS-1) TaxID=573370 RepID=C4XM62_SOLM1|nr:MucR family transcriptional regulator [Solidesulfovibrio magneticus]BAH77190.1 hypothetical protein DMR_36990 [Solidesulfovibrio magneticus RS-1]